MVEAFAQDLWRVVAPNPGPFTAGGTNTWLLGREALCVVDPGPDDPRHLEAVLAAVGARRVEAIVVTHAHRDHSGLAPALATRTGAPVLAWGDAWAGVRPLPEGMGGGWGVDEGFRPDRVVVEGEVLEGSGWRVVVRHAPGHMGNHVVLDDGERLWTGDAAMGWATSLVSPPEGEMGDYVNTLRRLAALGPRSLWPGHGAPVADGAARLRALLAHRLERESQVLEALRGGPATAEAITAALYAAQPPALRRAAARNVLAHLIHLAREERVEAVGALAEGTEFRLA